MSGNAPTANAVPRRILVRGVNWLGDAVMTTPALQRLRERFRDAEITLLAPEKLGTMWENHPSINKVISFAAEENLLSVARRLRDLDSDLALILPNSPRSALEPWLAKIPRRVGYARPWRSLFLTQAVPPRPERFKMRKRSVGEIERLARSRDASNSKSVPDQESHQLFEYLHLVAALGASPDPLPPKLEVTDAEIKQAEERTRSLISEKLGSIANLPILLGLNPGAEYGPAKRWPAPNFATVIREVSRKRPDCVWIAFGSENDSKACEQIEKIAGVHIFNLAGKTSLRELMASLKICRLLLTNDSGPMHVAAALGTPVVVPFGSTSPELTGPGLPGNNCHRVIKSTAPCSPCFRRICPIDFRCMTSISPAAAIREVLELIEFVKG